MTLFRLILIGIFISLLGYTLVTISNHGINLFPDFFGDMKTMAWPGQFNFDFMLMLTLSGLYVMWRHRFSVSGIGLGVLAFFGGALFLSAYLFYHSLKAENISALLLGKNA